MSGRYCAQCGALLGSTERVCMFCGVKVKASGPTATMNPNVPPTVTPQSTAPPIPDFSRLNDPTEKRVARMVTVIAVSIVALVLFGITHYVLSLRYQSQANS